MRALNWSLSGCIKLGALCALYMPEAGGALRRHYTEIGVAESVRFGLDLWTLGFDKLLEVI